jgi:hypothetical protein
MENPDQKSKATLDHRHRCRQRKCFDVCLNLNLDGQLFNSKFNNNLSGLGNFKPGAKLVAVNGMQIPFVA